MNSVDSNLLPIKTGKITQNGIKIIADITDSKKKEANNEDRIKYGNSSLNYQDFKINMPDTIPGSKKN